MKEEYNFSNARKNPYAKKLKKQVTINLDNEYHRVFQGNGKNVGHPVSDFDQSLFIGLRCEREKAKYILELIFPTPTAAALAAAVFGFVLLVLCFSMRFVHMQHVFIKGID